MDEFTYEGRKVRIRLTPVGKRWWDWAYATDYGPLVRNREELAPSRAIALEEAGQVARAEIRRTAAG